MTHISIRVCIIRHDGWTGKGHGYEEGDTEGRCSQNGQKQTKIQRNDRRLEDEF